MNRHKQNLVSGVAQQDVVVSPALSPKSARDFRSTRQTPSRGRRRLIASKDSHLLSTHAAAISTDKTGLEYRPIACGAPIPLPEKPLDPAHLESIVDQIMRRQLDEASIAGAMVSVVRGDETLLLKGYGQASIEAGQSMDATASLVRIGSVSKLFTWTAVMQLYEAGKLDIDADINSYLVEALIPRTFDRPVTLRNLLTHTPGLEDNNLAHMIDQYPTDIEPLAIALAQHVPAQIFPPTTDFADGRHASYSNWGGALAGLVVERVAGMPFEDYVEDRIFHPLGMLHTTFREPLPASWVANMATGYEVKKNSFRAQPFEYHASFSPAGSVSTTATDMARFMSAHLQNGTLHGQQILQANTSKFMHTRAFSPHPCVNGSALGFYERHYNGRRIIGHGGDTLYFHADVSLMPEQGLGIFVAYNTRPPRQHRGAVVDAIMDEFCPARVPVVSTDPKNNDGLRRYEGNYQTNRSSYSTFEKIGRLLDPKSTVRVRAHKGALHISNMREATGQAWIEVEPSVFREESGQHVIAFSGDEKGKATHILSAFPFDPAHRIGWLRSANFHRLVVLASLLLSGLFISAGVPNFLDEVGSSGLAALAHMAALGLAAANLLITALLVSIFVLGKNFPLYSITRSLRLSVNLPILLIPVSAFVLLMAIAAPTENYASPAIQTLFGLHAIGTAAFLFELHYWNVLGERFP